MDLSYWYVNMRPVHISCQFFIYLGSSLYSIEFSVNSFCCRVVQTDCIQSFVYPLLTSELRSAYSAECVSVKCTFIKIMAFPNIET